MNLQFHRQLRRLCVHFLLLLSNAAIPVLASAGDFDCGSDIVPVAPPQAPCEFELAETEELCGWGTHDSGAPPAPSEQPIVSAPVSSIDSTVTVLATSADASAGVSVDQIVEPFAMVGPYLTQSVETVIRFQSWWDAGIQEAEALRAADAAIKTDIQDELDRIAAQEPVDVGGSGASVLIMPAIQLEVLQPGIRVTAIDQLVGGSAIIATIEDSYLPYDLSARDMKLWSVCPTVTHPFCILRPMEDLDSSSMWQDFEAAVHSQSDVSVTDESYAYHGSAECLLDELIWHVDSWTAEDSPVWAVLEPRSLGRRLESLVSGGTRIAERAAQLLASNWPEAEVDNEPSPAGEALLARAGASGASVPPDPIAAAETQIANAPTGTILR